MRCRLAGGQRSLAGACLSAMRQQNRLGNEEDEVELRRASGTPPPASRRTARRRAARATDSHAVARYRYDVDRGRHVEQAQQNQQPRRKPRPHAAASAGGRPDNASMRSGATSVGIASARFATMPEPDHAPEPRRPICGCSVHRSAPSLKTSSGIRRSRACRNRAASCRTGGRRCCCRAATCRTGRMRGRRLAGTFDTKPTFCLIEHVVAAIEHRRPAFGRLEQIAQRRHRAVVQIRPAQPDAVERLVGVAVGLAEVRESVRRVADRARTDSPRTLPCTNRDDGDRCRS